MKKPTTLLLSLLLAMHVFGQEDNGNVIHQVWYPSPEEWTKGYIVNAGMDVDGDGWGEFLLWEVTTETYLLFEAYGDDQYHIVYRDQGGLQNLFDLDRDGQLELVKVHEDLAALEQWITVHEWNGQNFDENMNGGFTEATKTTNRFPRAFWDNIAEGHGFDRGLWDFKNLDGDDDWDIFAVDADITVWGGQVTGWGHGTIYNILEMTDFDSDAPQVALRYTSGPIGNGMLFFGIWNNYIDIDQDGLLDLVIISDHTQTLMGIHTAGNDSYDPIYLYKLPDYQFYHVPTWPVVANWDDDELQEIYFGDLDGQMWFMHSTGDFESTLDEFNIFFLKRIVPKQNSPGATNMLLGGRTGDQDGDGKPDIYYCNKDVGKLIDIEYQDGYAGDSSSFSYTYTDLVFSNGEPMNATMWQVATGVRYGNPLLDMDGDNKREIIIGGPDTDHMISRGVATLYIYESEHEAVTDVERAEIVTPGSYDLKQNYPNPFNPATVIEYSLPQAGEVRIFIYNLNGEIVKTFVHSDNDGGTHRIVWDGRDASGVSLSSGMYIYKMVSNPYTQTRKMLLVR